MRMVLKPVSATMGAGSYSFFSLRLSREPSSFPPSLDVARRGRVLWRPTTIRLAILFAGFSEVLDQIKARASGLRRSQKANTGGWSEALPKGFNGKDPLSKGQGEGSGRSRFISRGVWRCPIFTNSHWFRLSNSNRHEAAISSNLGDLSKALQMDWENRRSYHYNSPSRSGLMIDAHSNSTYGVADLQHSHLHMGIPSNKSGSQ
ncbi:hypothetical protein VNO77_22964 [Canavalia gladiata]|uniref:Uncharacterized protein n=1 Tax=Canavalia gladiata TaxID=3824 RepID=A0AAN9L8U3_CANGL